MVEPTPITPEEEQRILETIPDPKYLEELLNEEGTERNGEARRVALLILDQEIIDLLIRNKESILKGEATSIELDRDRVATKYNIEPPSPEMLRRIAEEIQRILAEKTYNVLCETKAGNWQEITVRRAPSLK